MKSVLKKKYDMEPEQLVVQIFVRFLSFFFFFFFFFFVFFSLLLFVSKFVVVVLLCFSSPEQKTTGEPLDRQWSVVGIVNLSNEISSEIAGPIEIK